MLLHDINNMIDDNYTRTAFTHHIQRTMKPFSAHFKTPSEVAAAASSSALAAAAAAVATLQQNAAKYHQNSNNVRLRYSRRALAIERAKEELNPKFIYLLVSW